MMFLLHKTESEVTISITAIIIIMLDIYATEWYKIDLYRTYDKE